MKIWQVAAGDGDRDYADLFLRFGLVAVGPGDPGPFEENRGTYSGFKQWSFLRPFHDDLQPDDLLVLKRPRGKKWEIVAVGRITSDYYYEEGLEDVEGWDLQHARKVDWRRLPKETAVGGLTRGTLKRIVNQPTQKLAEKLWSELEGGEPTAEASPTPQPELEDDELVSLLIDKGLSTSASETTVATIGRLRWLARWYAEHGASVGEHEIRTFLVAPLLLALGWPEQRIKIEYKRADMALWDRPFSDSDAVVTTIVETKRLYNSLGNWPKSQAKGYAEQHPSCSKIVITDGFRYKLFEREEGSSQAAGEWSERACANLRKLRAQHPIHADVGGAGDLILGMLP